MRMAWRFFFLGGFVFLIAVGMWAVVMITRMRREQASAVAMLRTVADLVQMKQAVKDMQDQAHPDRGGVSGENSR